MVVDTLAAALSAVPDSVMSGLGWVVTAVFAILVFRAERKILRMIPTKLVVGVVLLLVGWVVIA
ncbi:hypothetical protein [Haloarcula pellucida]|uniref:Uncharacterized protein n=1 Tax=Haloarcula pellucida TaxID=1427151 RepID=A0A830GKV7_9EURY|nr:hypothetical protein [Halomicroarcula pellucida]MBX0348687.1 hypothetical protein [Halomicroarcula pellucida]GGN92203.1 hypothetical protein GCM10009030_16220 [Halomicroarcula pellucida]